MSWFRKVRFLPDGTTELVGYPIKDVLKWVEERPSSMWVLPAEKRKRPLTSCPPEKCEHGGLCSKFGCPDDPNWKGDRR